MINTIKHRKKAERSLSRKGNSANKKLIETENTKRAWHFTNYKFVLNFIRFNVTLVNHFSDTPSNHQCFDYTLYSTYSYGHK